jgi:hypothetical protein
MVTDLVSDSLVLEEDCDSSSVIVSVPVVEKDVELDSWAVSVTVTLAVGPDRVGDLRDGDSVSVSVSPECVRLRVGDGDFVRVKPSVSEEVLEGRVGVAVVVPAAPTDSSPTITTKTATKKEKHEEEEEAPATAATLGSRQIRLLLSRTA